MLYFCAAQASTVAVLPIHPAQSRVFLQKLQLLQQIYSAH